MKPEQYHTIYIGGCEWRLTETSKPSWIKKYLQRNDSPGMTINGRCFKDHKAIFIRGGLHKQDRFETIFHEALHAVCAENLQNATLAALWDDEEATHIIAKGMSSVLRQVRDVFS